MSQEDDNDDELIPFNMRMPRSIVEGLDAWRDELNRGRRVGRVTRSDIVRVLLEDGIAKRHDLDVVVKRREIKVKDLSRKG